MDQLLRTGDIIEVVQTIDSPFTMFIKSVLSAWYVPKIQPIVGDQYLVEDNTKYLEGDNKIYNLKNLNRPDVFIKESGDIPNVGPSIKWIDELIIKGSIVKVNQDKGIIKKVPCTCPCHRYPGIKHIKACCHGGFRDVYIPYSQLDKDSLTLKK